MLGHFLTLEATLASDAMALGPELVMHSRTGAADSQGDT